MERFIPDKRTLAVKYYMYIPQDPTQERHFNFSRSTKDNLMSAAFSDQQNHINHRMNLKCSKPKRLVPANA